MNVSGFNYQCKLRLLITKNKTNKYLKLIEFNKSNQTNKKKKEKSKRVWNEAICWDLQKLKLELLVVDYQDALFVVNAQIQIGSHRSSWIVFAVSIIVDRHPPEVAPMKWIILTTHRKKQQQQQQKQQQQQ